LGAAAVVGLMNELAVPLACRRLKPVPKGEEEEDEDEEDDDFEPPERLWFE
jgi:hypothetical protein